MIYDRYDSNILNNFYLELFSSDFRDRDSATENAKTDCLLKTNNFNDWFKHLIVTFVDTTKSITLIDVIAEINKYPEFVSDMRAEYEELKELCDDED